MKNINVKITAINVLNFDPREKIVEFEIITNCGKMSKKRVIDDPVEIAENLILEIRRKLREKNTIDTDDVISGIVNVLIDNEEKTLQSIAYSLGKVSDRVNDIIKTKISDNYMSKINEIKNMKFKMNQ